MKILYGFLCWRKEFDVTRNNLELIDKPDDSYIVIKTPSYMNFNDKKKYKNVQISDSSIAKSKNMIFDYAREHKYDYCFIVEDDCIIKDKTVFDKYVDLMTEVGERACMYGYNKKNRVLGGIRPNPCAIVRVTDDREIYATRYPSSSFIGCKVADDMIMFDERLKMHETEFFFQDNKEAKYINSYGFFVDIEKSWNYFDQANIPKMRKEDQSMRDSDIKIREKMPDLDSDITMFFNFLRSVYQPIDEKGINWGVTE